MRLRDDEALRRRGSATTPRPTPPAPASPPISPLAQHLVERQGYSVGQIQRSDRRVEDRDLDQDDRCSARGSLPANRRSRDRRSAHFWPGTRRSRGPAARRRRRRRAPRARTSRLRTPPNHPTFASRPDPSSRGQRAARADPRARSRAAGSGAAGHRSLSRSGRRCPYCRESLGESERREGRDPSTQFSPPSAEAGGGLS